MSFFRSDSWNTCFQGMDCVCSRQTTFEANHIPSGNLTWLLKITILKIGKSSMGQWAIFHSYLSLPEGSTISFVFFSKELVLCTAVDWTLHNRRPDLGGRIGRSRAGAENCAGGRGSNEKHQGDTSWMIRGHGSVLIFQFYNILYR